MTRLKLALLAATALGLSLSGANARVTQFEVTNRADAYDGRTFGDAGAYERIDGIAHFAIDPASERGQRIVGLDEAPTNADGEVEFQTEVTIVAPKSGGSGTLFYEVPNRGRTLALGLLNLSASAGNTFNPDDPGDGFLMDAGHTLVWSGWQTGLGDALIDMTLPTIEGSTGTSREEFIFDDDGATSEATLTYPAADTDAAAATITVRQNSLDERQTPDGLAVRFLDENRIEITRPEGFDAGAIYEIVYQAKGDMPTGLAFVATADVVSFLRGNAGHDAEAPISGIDHVVGMGISQSGRFIRDLVYQGFNADAEGAQVFDGVMPHIAGSRKTYTNYAFAQPGRYSRQHEDHDVPGDQFPFTYAETTDPVTGATDGILDACGESDTCPKVVHTDTSTEFWQARAALVSTLPTGEPITQPEDVRLYFVAGAPHFNFWGGSPSETKTCVFPSNPISAAPTMRALTEAMIAWVADGTAPPDTVFPSGEALVAPDSVSFPVLDGARPTPVVNRLMVMDHGTQPPTVGDEYTVLVPRIDADGMPEGGVREPYIAAPTGSYYGWNLRKEGFAPGELCSLTGTYVAFPASASNADSRTPLPDRYADAAAYRSAVKDAAEALVAQGLMRAADVDWVVDQAPALTAAD
ncbi:alpha/beta hydrolase domain-containing protein [Acuticoccus sp. I52.16.1]|uniref:alpha/beta hydrolase domain-containing protein n=1 Tax=Acuticoccus sp. I52.16.1 TaxID=2928472 RepID=UPI001FD0F5E0|nr:alpha/beta hydrolase domain-containing protein [Acuticoccus sp. I52.16.1]UOM33501.1 hypothetical protein MRB58_16830 [Acuticoccus sp. I52.16.1]